MPAPDVLALLPRLYGLNPRLAAHVLRLWTLEALLRAHEGNVSAVARALGTSRSQVRRLAARHGLRPEAFRPEG